MKSKMFKFSTLVLASSMMLAACGKSDSKTSEDTIKIGANFELSGEVASYGNAEIEGARLAIEEINANGGILGKKVELVEMDNKSDVAEVTAATTKLADKDKVVAIIGPATSGATIAEISVANDVKVPVVSPSATSDSVLVDASGNTQPFGFVICFQDSFQGQVMAQFANNDLNSKNALIIMDNSSDYGKGLAKTFKSTYKGNIVATESYVAGETDFSSLITKVKGLDFDVVFIPGYYEEVGLIIKAAREAGIETPIIGADGFDSPELVNLSGASNLHDVYFSAHYSSLDNDAKVASFISAFKAKFNKEPNAFSALSYDGVYLIADAIERAGEANPEKVKEQLESTDGFVGVTGTISIGSSHNAIKSAVVIELDNGVPVSAKKVNP